MFKKFRNNLSVEKYKSNFGELIEQYHFSTYNGSIASMLVRAVFGMAAVCGLAVALSTPFMIASAVLPILAISTGVMSVGGLVSQFGLKGGVKVLGEWCKNAGRAVKTTLKGVDESVELRKKDSVFNFCKGFDEATSLSIKDFFTREKTPEERQTENTEALNKYLSNLKKPLDIEKLTESFGRIQTALENTHLAMQERSAMLNETSADMKQAAKRLRM
ncbi:MAG: hypothetical protein K8R48_07360 [Alphaproteobacteria bacterium]|nr:hypothetical protein [Alphaproteobacteria bacterium]